MGGSSKGGGNNSTPKEVADNLRSNQKLSIVDLVCEGQIVGPVNGLQSVFLNKTPLQNKDGSYNFSGVEVEWVAGSQEQNYLSSFASTENEIPISLEIKNDKPIIQTITGKYLDRLRVTVGVSSLFRVDDQGDIYGSKVQMAIQISQGKHWRTVHDVIIDGKIRSQYLRSYILTDLPATPFNLRVIRITPDSTSTRLENKTLWSSYTEIIDTKLTYPNTALVGLSFDSSQFNGIPKRQYLIRGLIIKIPSNYDPLTRTYQGVWDGSFKLSCTNNPAWIFYDLVTNSRYGLGKQVGEFNCDKWALYMIGHYCDQLVDDGFGGKEPRMTCNAYITSQRQAYTVLHDLCSVFRAMPIWDGLQLSAIMDKSADPVNLYSNANVIEGKFTYSASSKKTRHTAAHVRYIDPNHNWEPATEYVADDALIQRYGLNVVKVEAFGCTSRGQAHRTGKWLLATEKLEKQTVSFSVGREGLKHLPGDIIEIADNHYAGARIGGRIQTIEGRTVTLDRDVKIEANQQALLGYIDNEGKPQRVEIFSQPAANQLVLAKEVNDLAHWGMWTLATSSLKPRLFRALTISEESDGSYKITALQHVPEKEQIVDKGAQFEPLPATVYGGKIPPVEHLQVEALPESDTFQIRLNWDTPRVMSDLSFEVKLLREDKVHKLTTVHDTVFICGNLPLGEYKAIVRGKTPAGQLGVETTAVFTIAAPALPDDLRITTSNYSVTIQPINHKPVSLGTQYQFYKGNSEQEVRAQQNSLGRAAILNDVNCQPGTEYWYGIEAINAVGRSTLMLRQVKTQTRAEDILNLIGPEIPKLDWALELNSMVANNSAKLVMLSDRAALVVNKQNRVSGITVTAGDQASAIDFLADFVSFSDPDTLQRNLYWDNKQKTLVLKGQIKLLDGTSISGINDIKNDNAGGGFYRIKTTTGAFPADKSVVNSLFSTAFGKEPGQDTVLTIYALNDQGFVSHAESKMYSERDRDWVVPKLFIDGNLIAAGTIKGDRITAGTEINSPVINAGTLKSTRIENGQFYVDQHGNMTASNANISGHIKATSGELNNVVIGENCQIAGKLKVSQIEGAIFDNIPIEGVTAVSADIIRKVKLKQSDSIKRLITFSLVHGYGEISSYDKKIGSDTYHTVVERNSCGIEVYINNQLHHRDCMGAGSRAFAIPPYSCPINTDVEIKIRLIVGQIFNQHKNRWGGYVSRYASVKGHLSGLVITASPIESTSWVVL